MAMFSAATPCRGSYIPPHATQRISVMSLWFREGGTTLPWDIISSPRSLGMHLGGPRMMKSDRAGEKCDVFLRKMSRQQAPIQRAASLYLVQGRPCAYPEILGETQFLKGQMWGLHNHDGRPRPPKQNRSAPQAVHATLLTAHSPHYPRSLLYSPHSYLRPWGVGPLSMRASFLPPFLSPSVGVGVYYAVFSGMKHFSLPLPPGRFPFRRGAFPPESPAT